MKPTIAVIGIENDKGREIVRAFAKSNCRLLFYSDDLQLSQAFLKELVIEYPEVDAEILDSKITATWEADIIVTSVPEENISQIAAEIKDVACQKIIIAPASISADSLNRFLPHCKIVTIGENFVISGKDNESVESVMLILQNAA